MKCRPLVILPFLVFFFSCSVSRQIGKSAKENVLNDEALQSAHVGISIYEPATGKYWYKYQADKYFTPASNTKLATCYAAMKYLGDSLVGLRYDNYSPAVVITGTGDPTFLHKDFPRQPVLDFLKNQKEVCFVMNSYVYQFKSWGAGWPLDDFLESYMPERSAMPIYGNVVRFYINADTLVVQPHYFQSPSILYTNEGLRRGLGRTFTITRTFGKNDFYTPYSNEKYHKKISFSSQTIPFATMEGSEPILVKLLSDTLHKPVSTCALLDGYPRGENKIYSQPTDSLLKPMMHRSDNFFAEQTLLMTSNELLGVMNDAKIIDTLLKTDYKNLPQKPRWVDGSGLSRYNLFTPQDFVFILDKMKSDFGMERIKSILPTGNEGTLSGRFVRDSNYIFAKTGSLSGVVSLSGFLYTKKNRLLIFSVLVNNHNSSANEIRRAEEKFIERVRERF